MKDIILITGGRGNVAQNLFHVLRYDFQVRFLTRDKTHENEYIWDVDQGLIDVNALRGVKHIIHLAGASIADKRWTDQRKKQIFSSRVDSAKLLLHTLKTHQIKIDTFISASAIGYYGENQTGVIFTESMPRGADFLSDVCVLWEKEANKYSDHNISKRVIILRLGIVLSKKRGVLEKMSIPIRYYMGAILGKGNQYMPWIHMTDLCFMIRHLLENKKLEGVYNAVAPQYITNKEFTLALAREMCRPLCMPNIPDFIIRLLLGNRSKLLLEGSKVSAEKIMRTGFKFTYLTIEKALKNCIHR